MLGGANVEFHFSRQPGKDLEEGIIGEDGHGEGMRRQAGEKYLVGERAKRGRDVFIGAATCVFVITVAIGAQGGLQTGKFRIAGIPG